MPAIFISYRRSDSAAIVGRIYDRLVDRYGAESTFLDIDSIVPAQNFHDRIKDTLKRSDIVLVVVGLGWRGPREDGQYRICHVDDLVRTEVEMALERKSSVVPVLVDGAIMPAQDELPTGLKEFARLKRSEDREERGFPSPG